MLLKIQYFWKLLVQVGAWDGTEKVVGGPTLDRSVPADPITSVRNVCVKSIAIQFAVSKNFSEKYKLHFFKFIQPRFSSRNAYNCPH